MGLPETAIAAPPLPSNSGEARFRAEMGQISRHSGVFFIGSLFTAAAGYLFKIYVARVLGAGALGTFALGMTIVGFFGLFNTLGLPQAAVRFVATYSATQQYERLHAFLHRAIGLLIAANIALAAALILSGPWLARNLYHVPELIPFLRLFAIILVLAAFGTFFGQVLAGYKDIALRTVITSFVASPLNILLGVALLASGMGLRGYIVANVVSAAIVLGLLLAATWKLTPVQAQRAPVKPVILESEVLRFSAAVFGVSLLEYVLSQADKILMGVFLEVQQVGIYTVAASLITFVPVALQSVNQIFSPTIADLHARGEIALLGRMFQTLTKWITGLTLPLAFVMIIYSKPLMRLFGPAFEAGWAVLVIGTLAQVINTAVGSVGYLLLMSGNQKRLVRIQVIMAAFMVAATLALVRPWGMVGVASAAALTTAITNYLCLREVRTALRLSPYNRTYLRLIVPCAVSLAAVLGLRIFVTSVHPEWLMIAAAVIAAYVTFCGLSLAFGLDNDDRIIAGAVQRRLLGALGRSSSLPQ